MIQFFGRMQRRHHGSLKRQRSSAVDLRSRFRLQRIEWPGPVILGRTLRTGGRILALPFLTVALLGGTSLDGTMGQAPGQVKKAKQVMKAKAAPRAPVLVVPMAGQEISEDQFNSWVFRQDRTPDAARRRLESSVAL